MQCTCVVPVSLECKKMEIDLDISEQIVIEADAGRLIQVMVNLLSNAINYSKEQRKSLFLLNKYQEMRSSKCKMKESALKKRTCAAI